MKLPRELKETRLAQQPSGSADESRALTELIARLLAAEWIGQKNDSSCVQKEE